MTTSTTADHDEHGVLQSVQTPTAEEVRKIEAAIRKAIEDDPVYRLLDENRRLSVKDESSPSTNPAPVRARKPLQATARSAGTKQPLPSGGGARRGHQRGNALKVTPGRHRHPGEAGKNTGSRRGPRPKPAKRLPNRLLGHPRRVSDDAVREPEHVELADLRGDQLMDGRALDAPELDLERHLGKGKNAIVAGPPAQANGVTPPGEPDRTSDDQLREP